MKVRDVDVSGCVLQRLRIAAVNATAAFMVVPARGDGKYLIACGSGAFPEHMPLTAIWL